MGLLGLIGYGGGATGLPMAGGAKKGIDASGGLVNDYEDANNPGTYWRTHMFQVSGSFVVSELSSSDDCPDAVDILLIGGGGGGTGDNGGGGGAGGYLCYSSSPEPEIGQRTNPSYTVTAQTYPITIGAGGKGTMTVGPETQPGEPGSNSVFSSPTGAVYTAGYGGGGGSRAAAPIPGVRRQPGGAFGGSGGGGGLNGPGPVSYTHLRAHET